MNTTVSRPWLLVLLVATTSAALVITGHGINHINIHPDDMPDFHILKSLCKWDAEWYGGIARDGYWYKVGEQSPVAFFPLFPLVIRALTWTGLNRWVAGPLLSFCCALLGMLLFRRWALLVKPTAANTAFLALLLYPFTEYLYGVMYSDGLFLVLGVLAFTAEGEGSLSEWGEGEAAGEGEGTVGGEGDNSQLSTGDFAMRTCII